MIKYLIDNLNISHLSFDKRLGSNKKFVDITIQREFIIVESVDPYIELAEKLVLTCSSTDNIDTLKSYFHH